MTPDGEIRFSPLSMFSDAGSDQAECVDVTCGQNIKKVFKANDKLIIYSIKKLITEMTELCNPSFNEDRAVFMLKKIIT